MTNSRASLLWLAIAIVLLPTLLSPASAGEADADVIEVRATDRGAAGWTFHVTVAHPDTGWDDYCNGWDVVTDDGVVLKADPSDPFTRLLFHPHETEQPFTRSQGGLTIPDGVTRLVVRAHDIVDGFGGKEVEIDLSRDAGPGYRIEKR